MVSQGRHPRQNRRPASGSENFQERSCCVSPQQPIFQGPDLGRPYDFALPTFQGLWQTQAASACCREPDAPLPHHPIHSGGVNTRRTTYKQDKRGRKENKGEGGYEGDGQTQQLSFFSLIKSFLFSSDTRADNGLAAGRSHVSEPSPFPSALISCLMQIRRDEGWRRSPQEGSVIGRILSEDAQ